MEFVIKPNANSVEYTTNRGVYKGKHKGRYIVKYISIALTSDDPTDLMLLAKHKKPIERAIVNQLNSNVGRKKNDDSRN